MKKFIYPIIISGLLIFIVACSSGKYTGSEQNEIEKDNTIIIDSMSASQLNKLLEDSVQNVVITTDETKILVQKVFDVNDFSITILSRPDYEEFEKKVEEFREDYLDGKVTSKDYPTRESPDTVQVPVNSILSISYSIELPYKPPVKDYYNYSEDKLKSLGGGYELNARKNELTAGLLIENQLGLYRLIVEYNTTFNYSTDKLRISSSALYSLGYTFLGLIIGSVITGDPILSGAKKKPDNTDNTILWTLVGLPLLITNAEHQFYIINPSANNSRRSVGLSVFAGFRTDIFDTKWIVYSPGAGIQIEYFFSENNYGSYNNSMNFQVCVEYPYEFRFNQFQEPMISAGIKYKIGF